MDTQNLTSCQKRNGKKVSFEFKIFVISQINNGQISTNFAAKKYNISRSTIDYWRKKAINYSSKNKAISKDQEIKKLKDKLDELEIIKDFQQDIIAEFEKVTGKELSKSIYPNSWQTRFNEKRKN